MTRTLLSEIANSYTIQSKDMTMLLKFLTKLLDPLPEKREDYMQVGRAYYNGEDIKTADSLFTVITKKYSKLCSCISLDCQNIFKDGS